MALMVDPTDRLLRLFSEYGARLTIMADVAEIIKYRDYFRDTGNDRFHYQSIKQQLRDAIKCGHDVQLHIHSSYFGARFDGKRWKQNWDEYDFASLPPGRMDCMVDTGKRFLESMLRPVDSNYRCYVFRAANWSVSPSENVVKTLENNDIRIDTSVFKYGRREGRVNFDYRSAYSALRPWRVNRKDICRSTPDGPIWEFPIYAENRSIAAFATAGRLHRAVLGRHHRIQEPASQQSASRRTRTSSLATQASKLFAKHAWKADFNQCTGRQLISALKRAESGITDSPTPIPFVLIGHSKLFTDYNARSMRPLLKYIAQHRDRVGFGGFSDFDLHQATSCES
ncbi:hypothetical protein [Parahaliea mediterranea]|uniref:Uncharacterized protein n=1 Tax=Parahaliea mediterranea TaxID=651086 RepID=A0A939DBR8_9GAMM|nr:hypothetical protein [Parahaliea mediterranea]MBN7795246.1 hypothetical protein [Parahaliea mediterranea]